MKRLRFLSLCLCLALLAGCTPAAGDPTSPPPTGTPKPSESAAPSQPVGSSGVRQLSAAILPELSPLPIEDGAKPLSAFGVELLRRGRTQGEGVLVSPLSVVLALGMTANGADGDTMAAFAEVLGVDLDTLNGVCAAMLADYKALGGSTEAELANSLWADPDLLIEEDFVARCTANYGAQLFQADLQDPATVEALNGWVSDATRGLIPQIVDKFDEDAMLALVNAVYLKNKFSSPMEAPTREWTLSFTAEDGTVTEPLGMDNGTRYEDYIAAENGQGVVLPYDDGRLGLLLMLPDEGVTMEEYLSGWDGDTVKELLDKRESVKVALTMPKFKAEWSGSLADTLKDMGLAVAFDQSKADFLPMGRTVRDNPLCIGDVIHKTSFEVNEEGTEAAAVTAVIMMECTSVGIPEEIVYLRLDRPFVYSIVDLETGFPLFLGTLETVESAEK